MSAPLDHPDDCGCQVCRNYRERLETDPRAREIHASRQPDDEYEPDPVPDDPDGAGDGEAGEQRRVVVVEHHYETTETHEHEHKTTTTKADTKDLERRTRRLERKARRRHRRHGILRTLAVGAVLVWLLQSFYPELDVNVPLVPGVACTDPGTTQNAGLLPTNPHFFYNPFRAPEKGRELVEEGGELAKATFVAAVKTFAVSTAAAGLNLAGDTVRVMADHPPTTEGIRAGLMNDAETVGKVVGFIVGGLKGKSAEEMTPDATTASASGGCTPCVQTGTVTGQGAVAAAHAAQQAGFTGDGLTTAVAVALAESGARSVRSPQNSNGTYDHGFWQINTVHADLLNRYDWRDPVDNARMAYEVSSGGSDWTPWTTYDSGAYRAHLDEARAAVTGVDAVPVSASTTVKMDGLQPVAQKAADYVRSEFGATNIGGYSYRNIAGTNTLSEHAKGLAIDVMLPVGPLSNRIAAFFAGPGYKPFGVNNVIHNRRIYNAGRGWHAYTGASPHTDHVHIDFRPSGGTGAVPAGAGCVAEAVAAGGHRVATFNILGARHTPGTWEQRWPGVPQLLASHGVSVAGLQEVHPEQRPHLDSMPGWDTFGDWDAVTAWRTDTWRLEESGYVNVPMYPGRYRKQPLVKLRNASGESVWFLNVHNSRNGAARHAAMRAELKVADRLDGPVVWLGDTNDRGFAGWVARHGFRTAGTRSIDQIAGAGVTLVNGTRLPKTGVVARTSDHTLVYADLTLDRVL